MLHIHHSHSLPAGMQIVGRKFDLNWRWRGYANKCTAERIARNFNDKVKAAQFGAFVRAWKVEWSGTTTCAAAHQMRNINKMLTTQLGPSDERASAALAHRSWMWRFPFNRRLNGARGHLNGRNIFHNFIIQLTDMQNFVNFNKIALN